MDRNSVVSPHHEFGRMRTVITERDGKLKLSVWADGEWITKGRELDSLLLLSGEDGSQDCARQSLAKWDRGMVRGSLSRSIRSFIEFVVFLETIKRGTAEGVIDELRKAVSQNNGE
jgi:hypothetical protein